MAHAGPSLPGVPSEDDSGDAFAVSTAISPAQSSIGSGASLGGISTRAPAMPSPAMSLVTPTPQAAPAPTTSSARSVHRDMHISVMDGTVVNGSSNGSIHAGQVEDEDGQSAAPRPAAPKVVPTPHVRLAAARFHGNKDTTLRDITGSSTNLSNASTDFATLVGTAMREPHVLDRLREG